MSEEDMKAFYRYMFFILLFVVLQISFVAWVYSQDKTSPEKSTNIETLFKEMGIESNYTRLNPCLEIEDNARRYCQPYMLKQLLKDEDLTESQRVLLESGKCELIADHLDRICRQENFKKMWRHFSTNN